MSVPQLVLSDGKSIPQLGYGVWQVGDAEVVPAVEAALATGYRHIDTAAIYGNEVGVGQAIANSLVARDELFITTKLWNSNQGYEQTLKAFDESLAKLGLDYVDLYLIHWPIAVADRYVATWKAFEKLQAEGRVKSIGVSNFQPAHLARLHAETTVRPVINQVELHPLFPQKELREAHAKLDIATEAWSPLAQGGELLGSAVLATIAEKYGKSAAQVVIRWHLQQGNVVIPKSVTPARIVENFDVFDFELTPEDVKAIDGLETGTRVGPHPDEATFGLPE